MYPWLSRTISQVKRSGNEKKKADRCGSTQVVTTVPNNNIIQSLARKENPPKHPAFQPGPVIFSHEQDTGQRKKKGQ